MQFLHNEIVPYKCKIIEKVLLFKPYYFSKQERIIKHAPALRRSYHSTFLSEALYS